MWCLPKKLANPTLRDEIDTLVGTLDDGPVRIATAAMGYGTVDLAVAKEGLAASNFLPKIIPRVDGKPRIRELVENTIWKILR